MDVSGLIFDIQRFSVHDGPGIRTTVFLKGCSLHCFWCHNPEGIRPQVEVQFLPERCLHCGACFAVCPQGAQGEEDGRRVYRRDVCIACGRCAETCYAEALMLVGRWVTAEQVVDEVMRDRAFYRTSGGGVTLSGGEPALQPAFSLAILERCHEADIHMAIETAGNVHWNALETLLPMTDLVMMDLKHLDPAKHKAATGVGNERILANARRLAQTDKPLIFRIPVVPSVNDTIEEIGAIAAFVHGLVELREARRNGTAPAPISLELLPFHRLAADKYRSLGLEYRARELAPPSRERMTVLIEAARDHNITVRSR